MFSLMIKGYVESWTRKRPRLCELWEYVILIFCLVSYAVRFLKLVCEFILAQEEEDMWMVRDDMIDVRMWTCVKEDVEWAVFHPS